jgi:hypothetical protein
MKAKELDPGLYPQKEVVKAYQEVGQEYELTIHDRVYQNFFYPKITGNDKLKEQEIEYRIDALYRSKDYKGNEWLTYHVSMVGNDWEGNRVDYTYMAGVIEGFPKWHRSIDPQTDKVIPNKTQIDEMQTIYTIPYSKQKVNDLQKHFSGTVSFIVRDKASGGRRYTCSLKEFTDDFESLIDLKNGWAEYQRSRQRGQLKEGGVK